MKKAFASLLLLLILLSSCTKVEEKKDYIRYEASFLSLFDTVTTIVGYAESKQDFQRLSQNIYDELLVYHQMLDIYNDYEGINNIKTINDNAGVKPVKVDEKIIDFLLFCNELQKDSDKVNIALGSVLSLWHEKREEAYSNSESATLPDFELLKEASTHTDFSKVVIDKEDNTVFITDSNMRLDVGAVAKGYAAERVIENVSGIYLLSVGGNVISSGPKPDNSPWIVGLQDADGEIGKNKHTLYLEKGAVVTSGIYQRYYTVEGKAYHHIIDPDTLMPGDKWKAVSVVAPSSAVADFLSTALFLTDVDDGQRLLDKYDAVAIWTEVDGNEIMSTGFQDILRT